MKYPLVYFLILASLFATSCKQNKQATSKETIKTQTTDSLNSHVWGIKQDRNGKIWFATSDGVYRFDGTSFTSISDKLIPEPVFSVFEDSKGNFWFGSYGSGAYYYDGKSFQNFTTKDGLANNSVMPIYEDKDGIIWLGTAGGVSRYDGKSFQSFTTKDGLSNNDVHAIVQDNTGKMWFANRRDMNIYDGRTFTALKDKSGKTFRNVWSMIKDKKGNIWFGADGLWRYDGKAFSQIDQIGAGVIIEDAKGNILTSIGDPISLYNEQTLSDKNPQVTIIKTKYEGRRNLPFGLLAANDGSIWIGSERYNYDGKTLTEFKNKAVQK
jgi:streptogramin lyase